MADLIAAYLDEFRDELVTSRRRKARIVAEVRDHLLESAAAFESHGMPRGPAEREAVAAFGHPIVVARRFSSRAEMWWLLSWALAFATCAGVAITAYGAGWLLISLTNWWLDGDPHELRATLEAIGLGALVAGGSMGARWLLLDPSDTRRARAFEWGVGWLLLAFALLLFAWGTGRMAIEQELSVRMLRSDYFAVAPTAAVAGWVLLGMPSPWRQVAGDGG